MVITLAVKSNRSSSGGARSVVMSIVPISRTDFLVLDVAVLGGYSLDLLFLVGITGPAGRHI